MLTNMLGVIRLEIPVSRLMKVDDDRHDLTQISCSARKRFLLPSTSNFLSQTGRKVWQKSSTLTNNSSKLHGVEFLLGSF